ncbi:MAG: lipoprotein [Pseudomonadota bacterium]
MRRPLVLLTAAALLAGCGQHGPFRDRGYDYLKAEPGKPLVYPEGLTPIAAQELYPVPDVEQRRPPLTGRKPKIEIPPPPQVVVPDTVADAGAAAPAGQAVPETRVLLTRDGNGYPVLMLDLDFDWAWQAVGDALKKESSVKVEDLDRGLAVYYVILDGKRNSAGEPWQLKLNYTANGVQVALQVDENAMAPVDVATPLMQRLKDGIR